MNELVLASPGLAAQSQRSLAAMFEQQAAATPDNAAVMSEEGVLTYRELDAKAGRIAGGLAVLSSEPDRPIALFLPEGGLLYASMLAALKANRIFVPLELTAPESWLAGIVAASGTAHILADRSTVAAAERIAGPGVTVLDAGDLDRDMRPPIRSMSTSEDAPAYIMYTSGSTGRPKGVAISNRGALHRVFTRTQRSRIKPGDRLAHLRSTGFVAGITNVLATLLNGATVLPFDVAKHGFHKLASWLQTQNITGFTITSSLLRTWLASLPDDCRFPKLRVVAVGSEPLYAADIAKLSRHLAGDWIVVHSCGSTEVGAFASGIYGPGVAHEPGILPVGKILPGYDVRLQNEGGSATQPGDVGEIIVRSDVMALGYWKEPVLTAAAFSADGDAQVYRTGDLGRWRNDGTLEHLGRKDRKIKLRGFTIELYQVECGLLAIEGVRDAVVVLHKDGPNSARLVAYVVGSNRIAPPAGPRIRTELAKRLPGYMVPAEVILLDAMPLTGRGKVDRAALPPPSEPGASRRTPFRPPATEEEVRLAEIWRTVLGLAEVGADDDFYELGGTSLQAFLIFARIANSFGHDLPPTSMMDAPTVAAQANLLTDGSEDCAASRLFAFRLTGRRPPLFIVHGGFGDIMFVRELVRDLKSDRPVYGIQPPPLDGAQRFPRSVEAIAADYLAEIRKSHPAGPYCLAGYSFGGFVALEMAQQMTQAGEMVEFLGLIDTNYDAHYDVAGETSLSRTGRHLRRLRGRDGLTYMAGRAVKTLKRAFETMQERVRQWPCELRLASGRPIAYDQRTACYRRIYFRARRGYSPKAYRGTIALFARGGAAEWHRQRWNVVALGGLSVHEIPAGHLEIVWPPHSTQLAGYFDDCLDTA